MASVVDDLFCCSASVMKDLKKDNRAITNVVEGLKVLKIFHSSEESKVKLKVSG